MKKIILKPITATQQKQVAGGHIGDGSGPIYIPVKPPVKPA